jgi:hypothetical protein
LYGERDQQSDGKAASVEGDVERRRVPAVDEVLVDLVRRGVGDSDYERRLPAAERTQEQRAEDRVLREVRAFAQHLVPGAEPGRERGDRREPEDHRGPRDDRTPKHE